MTARIYTFPDRYTRIINGYKISLYNEEEIFITITAMNVFGNFMDRVTDITLENYDPYDVMHSLTEAKSSQLFSNRTKQIINKILKSIEPI
jgi:uncharacterized protein YbjQ (UPF0145 family)